MDNVKLTAPRPAETDERLVRDKLDLLVVTGLEARGFDLSDGCCIVQSLVTDKFIRLIQDISRDVIDGL